MKYIIIIILIVISNSYAYAEGTRGVSGADFLDLGTTSRALSMGEAYTAVLYDLNGVYYNPAVLGTMKYPQLSLFHHELIQDSRFENVSVCYPLYKGYLGFNTALFWVPSFEKVDINGNNVGDVSFYNSSNALSYGIDFSNIIAAGGSIKYIYQRIDELNANSLAVDLGVLKSFYLYSPFVSPNNNFSLGLSFLNMGTSAAGDPLPRKVRFGVSYQPTEWITISADTAESLIEFSDIYDFTYGFDESFQVNTGLELSYYDLIFFRTGYKFNDADHLTVGFGFNYVIQNIAFTIDTSYSNVEIFGPVYSITVGFKLIPKVITISDKSNASKYYQQGIQQYMSDDLDAALESFEKAKAYNPYMKNIDDKIIQLRELKELREENQKEEDPISNEGASSTVPADSQPTELPLESGE